MNVIFFKRRYLDLRLGGVTINPIIQAANFVMISYTILILSVDIPFWIYAPLFFIGVFSTFGVLGLFFRTKQLSTDENLKYEQQVDFNKTLYEIMKAQRSIMNQLNIPISTSYNTQLDNVKSIAEKRT